MCLAGNDYVKYSQMRTLHEVENTEWMDIGSQRKAKYSYQRSTFVKKGCFEANKHSCSI